MRLWKPAATDAQIAKCMQVGAVVVPSDPTEKLGIALNVRVGVLPVHGLRLPPEGGTCGWYIWAGGEASQDPDFFQPLHVAHVAEWTALVEPYLALPPGWRFLVAPDHEDVWFEPAPQPK